MPDRAGGKVDRSTWLWTGVLVGSALFLALAVDQVAHGPLYRADFPIDAWMTHLNATGLPIHPVGDLMSRPGSLVVDVPFLLGATLLLAAWGRWDLGMWCLGSGTLIGFLNPALKALFRRPLPPFIFNRYPHGFAFPSGHTMGAAGTLGVVILLLTEGHVWRFGLGEAAAHRWRIRAVTGWVVVSVVTGIGRILSQNHWLSDVLSAWAISAALVCATLLLVDRYGRRPRNERDRSGLSHKTAT